MFCGEASLVHGEKVHSVLEEIGIEDDETMVAVLTMDDERLNDMLQETKRLNLVEKFSVIQAMRTFGKDHKIARPFTSALFGRSAVRKRVVYLRLNTASMSLPKTTRGTMRLIKRQCYADDYENMQELKQEAFNLEEFTDERNQSSPSCKIYLHN
ncbi:hypothetical protein BDR07DRAFT_1371591 [Suillus spraguei]|nr:hypothetical protein BDR07DRAFT_1371591 [Suillus spraguei]